MSQKLSTPAVDAPLLGIIGAGGFGREVASFAARDWNCVFVQSSLPPEKTLNGHPWLSLDAFLDTPAPKAFVIAIADGRVRKKIDSVASRHCVAQSLIAPNAVVGVGVRMGDGAIICPFSTVTADARIGRHFHANIYSYVAHDCVIGDFVTFAPMACCNGNVHIGDHAYIGTGAKIRQGTAGRPLRIGRGAVIGMGAVVLEDVPDGATVVGVPAHAINP